MSTDSIQEPAVFRWSVRSGRSTTGFVHVDIPSIPKTTCLFCTNTGAVQTLIGGENIRPPGTACVPMGGSTSVRLRPREA